MLQSCRRNIEGYVVASLNNSNKERKPSKLPRQLCWTIERMEWMGAYPFPEAKGRLFISRTNTTVRRGQGKASRLEGERTAEALDSTRTGGTARGGCLGVTRSTSGGPMVVGGVEGAGPQSTAISIGS